MATSGNIFIQIYHKFLGLFVEFDTAVYALNKPNIKTHKQKELKYTKKTNSHILEIPTIVSNINKLHPPVVIIYTAPSLLDKLKIKQEKLSYLFVPRNYGLNGQLNTNIKSEPIKMESNIHKITKKELHISRSVKTVEEILELEPYTNKYSIKNIMKLPIKKYPLKKERFSQKQLETIQAKLAAQAKCKQYSMSIENIYDKFPEGLYEDIKIEKDGTVTCILNKTQTVETGHMQILATGKRKYDPQITKTFIKYYDLEL